MGGMNGGPGWLLGNNNALLTDWKVSLHLALFELVGYCQALLGNSISESPVALVTEQQLNSRGKWGLLEMQGRERGGGRVREGGAWLRDEIWVAFS